MVDEDVQLVIDYVGMQRESDYDDDADSNSYNKEFMLILK